MTPVEFKLVREIFGRSHLEEGYTLGQLFFADTNEPICYTLEDEDRHLENGNGKVYGKSAIPTGRYKLELYNSPRHGLVPLFIDVPGFTYVEIHKANHAEELHGCVAVGNERTSDGVRNCGPTLRRIVAEMIQAATEDRDVFCTIVRAVA